MSFSSQVKNELCTIDVLLSCCVHAQQYAMLLFGKTFSDRGISFVSESPELAKYYAQSIQQNFSITLPVLQIGRKKHGVFCNDDIQRQAILERFGHTGKEPSLRINRSNLANDCCYQAFLRGTFLACGTVASPEKNYHLEFVLPYKRLSMDLFKLMEELEIHPKYINRKGYHVVYVKDSEEIEQVLTLMGATNATLELIGIKIHKDMRNRVNRRVNFETANIERTVGAAMQQVEAIQRIDAGGGIQSLPENLREVARLRLENPEASLRELSQMMDEPLSRSGINHRLTKIVAIAREMERA